MASALSLLGLGGTAATAGTAATVGATTAGVAGGTVALTTPSLTAATSAFTGANMLGSAFTGASMLFSVLQGMQGYQTGKLQSLQSKTAAKAAETEAISKANALREQALKDIGSANASYAARGLDLQGTPAQMNLDSLANLSRSTANVMATGRVQAAGHRAQAYEYKAGGAGSLLSGLVQAADIGMNSLSINRILGK